MQLRTSHTSLPLYSRLRFWIPIVLSALALYSIDQASANRTGVTGLSKVGCSDCHGFKQTSTIVTIATAAPQIVAGQTYVFTLTVKNPSEAGAGCDISVDKGAKLAVNGTNSGLQYVSQTNELTHLSPRTFTGDSAVWTFKFTAPATPGTTHIYAAGNAVNLDGRESSADKWNTTSLAITVVAPDNQPLISTTTALAPQAVVGADSIQTIVIRNGGGAALTINSYRLKGGTNYLIADTSVHSIAAHDSNTIKIVFHPLAPVTLKDTLLISSNDPSNPLTTIIFTGKGLAGRFAVTATTLNFGTIPPGSLKTATVTLRNPGTAPLSVSSISVVGSGQFIVLEMKPSVTLPHQFKTGDTELIVVQYAPQNAGRDTASLVFNYLENAGPARDSAIGLIGLASSNAVAEQSTPATWVGPNPATDHLAIEGSGIARMEFVGENGVTVLTVDLPGSRLNIGQLTNGRYLIRITHENGKVELRKIVIAR